jgi:hypothetical protein
MNTRKPTCAGCGVRLSKQDRNASVCNSCLDKINADIDAVWKPMEAGCREFHARLSAFIKGVKK